MSSLESDKIELNKPSLLKILGAIVSVLWLSSSIFILDSREIGVVTMFGEPITNVQDSGLFFKAPWPIQEVQRFDARAQLLEIEPVEVFTKDTKNLVMTPFVIWKIKRPTQFLERVRDMDGAKRPLIDVTTSRIAAEIGERTFSEVLNETEQKNKLLQESILVEINTELERFGLELQHIDISQLSLPIQNEQSIYERMRAERSRIANKYRSEGEEQAAAIRAKADREAVEIRVQAQQKASEIRSKAERQANDIYAKTYNQDPKLYELLRDLEVLEASLEQGGTLIFSGEDRPFKTLLQEEK